MGENVSGLFEFMTGGPPYTDCFKGDKRSIEAIINNFHKNVCIEEITQCILIGLPAEVRAVIRCSSVVGGLGVPSLGINDIYSIVVLV